MEYSLSRRRILVLLTGIVGTLSGCLDRSSLDPRSTPSPTPPPTATEQPADVILDSSALPDDAGTEWNKTRASTAGDGLHVNYEVSEDGQYSHQVSIGLTNRMTVDGAVFDHDKLVETYTKQHDVTTRKLPFGDVGTLVTFADEAHALVTYRNLFVHVTSYGGPTEQVIEVARRQIARLREAAPRPTTDS